VSGPIVRDPDPEEPIEGDVEELQQREQWDGPAVLVEHNGPVTVHDLPARVAVMRSLQLTTSTELISGRDMRRKAVLLLAESDAFYVGNSAAAVTGGTAAKWPAGIPLDVRHVDALYARAAVAGTVLTVIVEQWAD